MRKPIHVLLLIAICALGLSAAVTTVLAAPPETFDDAFGAPDCSNCSPSFGVVAFGALYHCVYTNCAFPQGAAVCTYLCTIVF